MSWPAVAWRQVSILTTESLRRADAEVTERFGIDTLQLMEVAGWQVARFIVDLFGGIRDKRVIVVAGAGNNGGDALVAGRFLHQRGARVTASIVAPRDRTSLMAHQLTTIQRLSIPCEDAPQGISASVDVIVDGLLGTGIHPPLRDPAPRIIEAMNATNRPIVAVDVPSGIDADTAAGQEAAVQAVATLTLAAPKRGLALARNAGRVFVADIGFPAALFEAYAAGLRSLYAAGDVVELVDPDV